MDPEKDSQRKALTGSIDKGVVQFPREERLGQLAEPQLEDSGNVVDVAQILLGQQVDRLGVCAPQESAEAIRRRDCKTRSP